MDTIKYLKSNLGEWGYKLYIAAMVMGAAFFIGGCVTAFKGDVPSGINFVLLGVLTWIMHTSNVKDILHDNLIKAFRDAMANANQLIDTQKEIIANNDERISNAEERVVILKDIIEAHKVTLARALSTKETHETKRD